MHPPQGRCKSADMIKNIQQSSLPITRLAKGAQAGFVPQGADTNA